tara:strand:+ start:180 stop:470 length:291 start_codon:yes stop_codon:yes gene_type:complete
MRNFVILAFLSAFMVSCGQNSNVWPTSEASIESVEPATSENYTYQFSGFRCNTGPQSAATFSEICSALKNDELNQGCAQDKREELYINAECPGNFI